MEPDTVSRTNDEQALGLKWSNRVSLTPRILAVNIFALAMLAGGFFYLDSFRARILDDKVEQAGREARLIAQAVGVPAELLDKAGPAERPAPWGWGFCCSWCRAWST